MKTLFALLLVPGLFITGLKFDSSMVKALPTHVNPVFLGDVNSQAGSSLLVYVGQLSGVLIFWPNSAEMWRSDGTTNGTYKLADITNHRHYTDEAVAVNLSGYLYFIATSDNGNAAALWRTDGSVAGTSMIKALTEVTYGYQARMVVFESKIFFHSGEAGTPIWKSDGTTAGTHEFLDLVPDGRSVVDDLHVFENHLLISVRGVSKKLVSDRWSKLLLSDGQSAVTTLLFEITDNWRGSLSEGDDSFVFYQLSGNLYRVSADLTVNLIFNSGSSALFDCGLRKCFFAYGSQLFSTDGTSLSTSHLKTFEFEDSDGGFGNSTVTFHGNGYYSMESSVPETNGIWETDGTQAGTRRILDTPAVNGIEATPQHLYFHLKTSIVRWANNSVITVRENFSDVRNTYLGETGFIKLVGDTVFFAPTTRMNGKELWATSDVSDSAWLIRDITMSSESNDTCSPRVSLNNGDVVTTGYIDSTRAGIVLYSMGSKKVTVLEEYELDAWSGQSRVQNLAKFGNSLLYSVDGNPWISDGGIGKATMLKRVSSSDYAELGPFVFNDSHGFFFAGNGTDGSPVTDGYLWRTDGTGLGTQQYVAALNASYVISAGFLYFHKRNADETMGLWRMNLANNVQTELAVGRHGLYAANGGVFMWNYSGSLSFISATSTQVEVIESWSTEGSDSESSPLGSVDDGSIRTVADGIFYIVNDDNRAGYHFSDGTIAGTRMLKAGLPSDLSAPFSDSKVMLFAQDLEFGLEPMILDSHAGSQSLLKDASPGSTNSYYQDLAHGVMPAAVINGRLYFDMIVHGGGPGEYGGGGASEIWESDGTQEGTRRVTNFAGMPDGPRFTHCVSANGDFIYFGAFTDSFGSELWAIDTRELVNSDPVVTPPDPVVTPPSSVVSPLPNPVATPPSSVGVPVSPSGNADSGSTKDGSGIVLPSSDQSQSSANGARSITTPVVVTSSVPVGAVKVGRLPSSAMAQKVLITVIRLKAVITLEPPKVKSKNSKIIRYTIQLRPKRGKLITKNVQIGSQRIVKIPTKLARKMTYRLTITALQKSGKRLKWNGPVLLGQ